ncbi:hypothetical protein [Flavobacterium sp. FlaQc-50]|uniref:hypothetical protein n=1 Tax=unclassified Flavobacterium TaxID=196869 RepID=UPI003756703C
MDSIYFTSLSPSEGATGTTIRLSTDDNPYKEKIPPRSLKLVAIHFIPYRYPAVHSPIIADSGRILDEIGYSRFLVRVPSGIRVGENYGVLFKLKEIKSKKEFYFSTGGRHHFTVR